jgi:hypothetical protein
MQSIMVEQPHEGVERCVGCRMLPDAAHAGWWQWAIVPGNNYPHCQPAGANAVPGLHLEVPRGLWGLRLTEGRGKQEGPDCSGPSCAVPPVLAEVLLLRVFRDHVDGPLAARIARIGGDVKADALPDLQHLEAAIGDRGVVEKELATSRVAVRLDESEAAIAERSNRTGCHRLEPTLSAALLARRHGGARFGWSPAPDQILARPGRFLPVPVQAQKCIWAPAATDAGT